MQTQLFTQAQVRALDAALMRERDIAPLALMQEAAQAAFGLLKAHFPQAKKIAVLAGAGNNGGDAFLLAKLAFEAGLKVRLFALVGQRSSEEALAAKAQALEAGLALEPMPEKLPKVDLVIDGLLGTGFVGELSAPYASAIAAINAQSAPVLALDIPSGLNADTGAVVGQAVVAEITACFVGLKQGLFTHEGPDHSGQVLLCTLGSEALKIEGTLPLLSVDSLNKAGQGLRPRRKNSHKGLFGHVLLVGGDTGMGGALLLASEACLRTGAGLLSCATREAHVGALLVRCPTAMVHAVRSGLELIPLLAKASVLAIGPGLGQSSWAELLLQQVLSVKKPLLLDADALNLLASPAWRQGFAGRQTVLTPHPGEAARLLGCSVEAVQQDRFASARALAEQYRAVVVLKGCGTVIASPKGELALCASGNSGMSSGGMGDVLTGIISGLLAQGLNAWQAACLGVCLHAQAGDNCAQKNGSRGMLAPDLSPFVLELIN